MDIIEYWWSLKTKFFAGDEIVRNWTLLVVMNVCAAGYLWLCFRLRLAHAARRLAFPYLVLFSDG